jgi:hypothetical protein
MDKPTGPTGILSSARKPTTPGGKKPPAKPGRLQAPGRSMGAMKGGR